MSSVIRPSSTRTLLATFAAVGALAVFAVPSLAKDKTGYDEAGYGEAYYDGEIVVIAPRTTGRTTSGARIERVTRSHIVASNDLDLRHDADVAELHSRIQSTAVDACNEVERASGPAPMTTSHECIRDAVRSATLQAEALIYAKRA
jgi:UrcA family protein